MLVPVPCPEPAGAVHPQGQSAAGARRAWDSLGSPIAVLY